MKQLLLGIVLIWTNAQRTNGLVCLECSDARSHEHCLEIGMQTTCQKNELACQTETRYLPMGRTSINKRCKQADACYNDSPLPSRNLVTSSPSCDVGVANTVCRCCCYYDACSASATASCPQERTTPATTTSTYAEPTCASFDLGLPRLAVQTRYCSDGFNAGSACRLVCPFPYQLRGSAYISCQKANIHLARWSMPPPCCTKFCPPFGNMNLIIAVDATQMTSRTNWQMTQRFAKNLLRQYTFAYADTSVGFFRFNDKVEVATAIPLGRFTSSEDFFEALDRIGPSIDKHAVRSYSKALQYALNAFQDISPKVTGTQVKRNVVLLLTTGPTSNLLMTNILVRWLGDYGVQILALGISTERDFAQLRQQLEMITQSNHKVYQTTMERLPSLVPEATNLLCTNSCSER